ncbi:hypothetical protein NMG60_11026033 [Bertholletia excelsa]
MEIGVGGKRKSCERPYKGIRMRKWGKWVAEIREPNKRTRIWLGSYSTPVAAARAYDTAVYYLRDQAAGAGELSAASIRKKAIEVGSRVDALETSMMTVVHDREPGSGRGLKAGWLQGKLDLNQLPEPEDSDSGDAW